MAQEILKTNFKDNFPKIQTSLEKAAFIAIDSEFSGINLGTKLKDSLFDSPSQRYFKLKQSIEHITIFRFGLVTFTYDSDSNSYSADVFNIYTLPCSFGPVDNYFLSQPSSWNFLIMYNFDFNKVAYEGVPFLNSVEEALIKKYLEERKSFSDAERYLLFQDEDFVEAQCSRIAEWLLQASENDTISIKIKDSEYSMCYILHMEIRLRFKDVWTFSFPNEIKVQKLNFEEMKKVQEQENNNLDSELLNTLTGFTKIFKLLVTLKKPIIGHNLLLDLMLLYKQMYAPLPKSYEKFKTTLNKLFPAIYDTKYISSCFKDILNKQKCFSTSILYELYAFLSSDYAKDLMPFSPLIEINSKCRSWPIDSVGKHSHEAAWDAYMSGYCFICLAHILAIYRLGEEALPRALTKTEHFAAMSKYSNCINVIGGSVSYINIGGEDPLPSRPPILYISRKDSKPINPYEVAGMLASYGAVDVKAYSIESALIAAPDHKSAQSIIRAFLKKKEYNIVPYSLFRHNPLINKLLWSGVIFSTSFCIAALLIVHIKKY